jgi:hypothetical protein
VTLSPICTSYEPVAGSGSTWSGGVAPCP